jgi:hypothetical protein
MVGPAGFEQSHPERCYLLQRDCLVAAAAVAAVAAVAD